MFDWLRQLVSGSAEDPDQQQSEDGYRLVSYHTPVTDAVVDDDTPHSFLQFSVTTDLIFERHRDLVVSVTVTSNDISSRSDKVDSIAIVRKEKWPQRLHKIWKSTAYCYCPHSASLCTHSYPYCYTHDGQLCTKCMNLRTGEHIDVMGGTTNTDSERQQLRDENVVLGSNEGSGVVTGLVDSGETEGGQALAGDPRPTYSLRLRYKDSDVKAGDYLLTVTGLKSCHHAVAFNVSMHEFEPRQAVKGSLPIADAGAEEDTNEEIDDEAERDDVAVG